MRAEQGVTSWHGHRKLLLEAKRAGHQLLYEATVYDLTALDLSYKPAKSLEEEILGVFYLQMIQGRL